jgi:hypothetical protein
MQVAYQDGIARQLFPSLPFDPDRSWSRHEIDCGPYLYHVKRGTSAPPAETVFVVRNVLSVDLIIVALLAVAREMCPGLTPAAPYHAEMAVDRFGMRAAMFAGELRLSMCRGKP